MLQQKKINANYSLNYVEVNYQSEANKIIKRNKRNSKQAIRRSSISHLLNENILNQDQKKQFHFLPNKQYQSQKRVSLSYKQSLKKNQSLNQRSKRKRSQKNPHSINQSSSAIVLSQTNTVDNLNQAKKKRKSFMRNQIKNVTIENQNQRQVHQVQNRKSKNKQKQKTLNTESKKQKNFCSKPNMLSYKKQYPSHRLIQYEKKKHLSCASILQGTKQKNKSQSKSKSKSKQKKNKKKKNSYKFSKINLNKQNENRNKPIQIALSIEKQFKSINKKIKQQLKRQRRKSCQSNYQNQDSLIEQIKHKKQDKILSQQAKLVNKQNKDPKKKNFNTFKPCDANYCLPQNELIIKKQPLHQHNKKNINQKIQAKKTLKLSMPNQKKIKEIKKKEVNNNIYFLIKKDMIQTPSSQRKQFPIDKYFAIKETKQKVQSRRTSFQKTVKPNKKRASLNQNQPLSQRSSSQSGNRKSLKTQIKPPHDTKTKAKKSLKPKCQTYTSCLYLWAQGLSKNQNAHHKASSFSDHDLEYKQQSQNLKEQAQIKNLTPKQCKILNDDNKQTIFRHKKVLSSSYDNQQEVNKLIGRISQDSQHIMDQTFIKYGSQSFNKSLNIDQIRYYESISPSMYQQQTNNYSNKLLNQQSQKIQEEACQLKIFSKYFQTRSKIVEQFIQEYPLLTRKQLQFFASVCFIQRKWREIRMARKIKSLLSLKNTSELFKKNRNSIKGYHQIEDKNLSNIMTSGMISKSEFRNLTTQSQNTQTQEFVSLQTQENNLSLLFKKQNVNNNQDLSPLIKIVETQKLKQSFYSKGYQIIKVQTQYKQISINKPDIHEQNSLFRYQTQDIFPDISYLKTKKHIQKAKYVNEMSKLNQQHKFKKISECQFVKRKQEMQINYKKSLKQIHEIKKSLKKGYLKYLQLKNQVQSNNLSKNLKFQKSSLKQSSSNKLLKRVNSQDSILGDIYSKIFKIQQISSDNGSESSAQTKRLNQMFLVRRLNDHHLYKGQAIYNKINGLGQNLGCFAQEFQITRNENNIFSQRHSGKLMTEQDIQKIINLSSRETQSMQLRQDSNKFIGEQPKIIFQQDFKHSNNEHQGQNFVGDKLQHNKKCQITQQKQEKSLQRQKTYNISQLIQLKNQAYSSEKQPTARAFNKDLLTSFKIQQIEDEIDDICFSLQENNFQDEIENNLSGENQNIIINIDDYNEQMPAYISPVSSLTLDNSSSLESRQFLSKFVQYLNSSDAWKKYIYQNLNKSQGFTPQAYLKFIRIYELPQDCYLPIIPHQAFVEWQNKYMSDLQSIQQMKYQEFENNLGQQQRSWQQFSSDHCKSVEHRSLYQLLNSQLEAHRIYSERGKPFPWEVNYSCWQIPHIELGKVEEILQKCLQKINKNILSFSCGIILENHFQILNEQELEQLHDRNEDKIIDMLQIELAEQKNGWYEIQEHNLEIKLEVGELIWSQLFNQVTKEMIRLKNWRRNSF